jgi:LacI family transcriptional regulator
MKRSDRITIIQVAERAGVSTATAGRVLGGYGYSSDELRTRVRLAAEELGYRPNQLARGLITGRTQTIGVVAADIENSFYARVVRGIADVARGGGFGAIITNSDENVERERQAVELLLEKQVDGLIISPADLDASPHLAEVLASGRPIVQIDRLTKGLDTDSVTVDNRAAARECVQKLIEAGHRSIAIIAELESSGTGDVAALIKSTTAVDLTFRHPSWQRLLGYLDAHNAAGLPVNPALVRRVGEYSAEAARDASLRLLALPQRPTALFAGDGTMSTGAMQAIAHLGLRVPLDLSLVCFDDLDWMSWSGVTTVAQPVHDLGVRAAELVLARIAGSAAPAQQVVLPAHLIERGSISVPRGADTDSR